MRLEERAAAAPKLGTDDGLRGAAAQTVSAARARVSAIADLASAEARVAARSGVSMLMFAAAAVAASIIAWLLLAGLATYWLAQLGLGWPLAMLLLAIAHALAAFALLRSTMRLGHRLTMPQLRRTLSGNGAASNAARSQVNDLRQANYVEYDRK